MSADEKIALTSVIVAGIVGVTSLIFGALGGWLDRRHSASLVAVERRQLRLADVYIDLLTFVELVGDWSQRVRPAGDTVPPRPVPKLPEASKEAVVLAKVAAYASDDVRELFRVWRDSVEAIADADRLVGFRLDRLAAYAALPGPSNNPAPPPEPLDVWNDLEDSLRPAEKMAHLALRERIAIELESSNAVSGAENLSSGSWGHAVFYMLALFGGAVASLELDWAWWAKIFAGANLFLLAFGTLLGMAAFARKPDSGPSWLDKAVGVVGRRRLLMIALLGYGYGSAVWPAGVTLWS